MEKLIFSKFSNERAEVFQIHTDIWQDVAGTREVRKVAACEAAKAHIRNLSHLYRELSKVYEEQGIHANRCTLSEDGSYVSLEYLTGRNFQDYLDELYVQGEYVQISMEIEKFAEKLRSLGKQLPFERTAAFEEVFGRPEFKAEKFGALINNIDLIFPNIILGEDGWTIIDYEWTFEFVIPVDFVIYRAIHYYLTSSKRSELRAEQIYSRVGIDPAEIPVFEEMEHCFQLYILGGTFGMNNIYPLVAGKVMNIEHIRHEAERFLKQDEIKVYYGFDEENFKEEDSVTVWPIGGKGHSYDIPVPQGIRRLRVDPGEFRGILHFKMAHLLGRSDLKLSCDTNGEHMSSQNFLFDTDDPYLIFEGFDGKSGTFHVELQLDMVLKDTPEAVKDLITDRARYYDYYTATLEQHKVISEAYSEALKKAIEYDKLVASASFKASKPIRVTVDGIKGFLHHHYWIIGGLRNAKRFVKNKGLQGMRDFNAREWQLRKNLHVLKEISLVYDLREMDKQLEEIKGISQDIKFSIIVPLYNTPELYLRKMIESVLTQTYENFELCLADGSDRKHRYVGDICREYRWHDKRVVYKKLKKNAGISGNTNACMEMATGDYFALFDHDDFLHPTALYENYKAIKEQKADFLYSDENTFHETIDDAYNPHYKPDFSPDYLRSVNYICHLTVFSRKLYEKVGGFRQEFDGSQDYDMILRLTEKAEKIVHIPEILYYWRAHAQSTAQDIHAKDYCMDAAKRALSEHLKRVGLKGTVEDGAVLSWYRMKYEIEGEPLISIIIPNKDHIDLLKRCIDSILLRSSYQNIEIIVVENNSERKSTFEYYETLTDERIRVVTWESEFNYSAINNFGVSFAKGEYILLLNNDMEVISEDWLQEMLMFAQRSDVGAVGAKLYYPDDTIQHAGVILGIGGVAGHSHKYFAKEEPGYFARLVVAQNLSAVTAACMMMPKKVFAEVGGLDEAYKVAFNDVDLCMKIRKAGYLIVYTPYAQLYHYESVSRGSEDTPEKVERFNGEVRRFMELWGDELAAGDPYYNKNLSLVYEDFRERE
ncbi:MAG: glycosyltransferase family 2 protein [Lachnospiraceae bacterium]|jgi:GT2 family glycosyltransferase|nr:glycosyltransferase family 2 protein [Lachnospiraceae bacterium]